MQRRRPMKIFAWISIIGLAGFLFVALGGGAALRLVEDADAIALLSIVLAVGGAVAWFLDAVACAVIDAADKTKRPKHREP